MILWFQRKKRYVLIDSIIIVARMIIKPIPKTTAVIASNGAQIYGLEFCIATAAKVSAAVNAMKIIRLKARLGFILRTSFPGIIS